MDIDDDFISRLFHLESGGDPKAITGSNRGLAQFSSDLERKYGITDWTDRSQQTTAVRREMAEFGPQLSKSLGRDPTRGELYLAHQQGLTGANAHFNNPDGTAWQNVRQYYPSDKVAKDAIWGNIPDNARLSPDFNKTMFPGGVDSVTSGHFANGWVGKFEGSPATLARGGTAGSVPVASLASAPAAAPVAGMLSGTDVVQPGGASPDLGAAFGRIAQLMQHPQQQQAQPLQPIPTPMPPGLLKARLQRAALGGLA